MAIRNPKRKGGVDYVVAYRGLRLALWLRALFDRGGLGSTLEAVDFNQDVMDSTIISPSFANSRNLVHSWSMDQKP